MLTLFMTAVCVTALLLWDRLPGAAVESLSVVVVVAENRVDVAVKDVVSGHGAGRLD